MTFNKILRYSIFGGIFFLPFVPFIVVNSFFFPFITGKAFTFRIIVEIIFGLWIILSIRDEKYRPRFSWILAAVIAFVSIIALADIFGTNFYRSFWSSFERMEGLITLIHLLMYFLVLSSVFLTEKIWIAFLNTTAGASVIMSAYSVFQLSGVLKINQGSARVDGTIGNASYLAVYLLLHIFILLFLIFKSEKKWLKWTYFLAAIFNSIILYYTATRGAILALFGGLFVGALLIAIFEKNAPKIRKTAIGVIIALFLVAGGFFALKDTSFVKKNPVLSRFSSISLSSIKEQGRYYVWPMAIKGFKDRPILGWGQENFLDVFGKYYNPQMWGQEPWFDRTHNFILDWLIAGGLLGLIAYLLLPIMFLYYIWKEKKILQVIHKSIFTGLVAAYIFHNLFVFDNLISYLIFFFLLAFGHALYGVKPKAHDSTKPFRAEGGANYASYVAIPILIVCFIFVLYFANIKPMFANVALIKSFLNYEQGPAENLKYFKKALSYDTFGNFEIRQNLTLYAFNFGVTDENAKRELVTLAHQELLRRAEADPKDLRNLIFLGSLYNQNGQQDNAIKYLLKAKELSPNMQSIRFELAFALLAKGEKDQALSLFKETYEMAPEYPTAKIMYLVGSIYADRRDIEKTLLDEIKRDSISNEKAIFDNRLITAYAQRKEFDTVIEILKLRLSIAPDDRKIWLGLAAAYFESGQRQKSIETLEKWLTITLDPKFKDEAEYYIKEIQAGRNP